MYRLVEFRRPFHVIGNHSEKNILSLQQSRQRRPIVPTGKPLQVNTHYYTIFSRARPSDIPYTHMRRQISVIKGCKVDLQLGPEYRTPRNASTNRLSQHNGSYQFIRNEWKSSLRWLRLGYNGRAAVAGLISTPPARGG